MDKLKIVSLNCRGLRGKKRYNIYRWLKEKKFDICLLQETYCTKDIEQTFRKGWAGELVHSFTSSAHSKGVSILFAKNLPYTIVSTYSDDVGRLLLVNINVNGEDYVICDVYCPNDVSERIKFLADVQTIILKQGISTQNVLIAGDFNCVDDLIDKATGVLDKSSEVLSKFKIDLELVDSWRHVNPLNKEYSFIDPSRRGQNSRIDLMLVSKSLCANLKHCILSQAPAPDHKAVVMEIGTNVKGRGRGYWKMNNSVIKEESYKQGIEKLYEDVMTQYGANVSCILLWEFLKIKIKEFTISYCILKSNVRKNLIKDLESKLDLIDKSIGESTHIDRKVLKQQLDSLYDQKTAGYHVRSRAKWVEEGEKSTSYFLNLEKSRQISNCIESLKDSNGTAQNSDDAILDIATSFYKNLYSTNIVNPNDDIDKFLNSIPKDNKLVNIDNAKCEGLLSYDECKIALNKMKKNKSPGLDGITTEFYQEFWPLIGNLLVNVYNESYENGNLSDSQRKSVMALIFKDGKRDDIANYRPISLTNVDYRILAFSLAERMQHVMNNIISTDQSAYIKRRYMGTNIRLVSDIIEYYDITNKSGLLLMLDFKKAFDSIEWSFMFKSLQFFNFGPSFIRWIETIYHKPVACVKNNGFISNCFGISRGIRQGCPVSALLFVICVEILGTKIRTCKSLQGFHFGYEQKPAKITQYADDGILFLNNKTEVCSAINILETFGQLSGLILNKDKCQGFWLGKDKLLQQNCTLFGIKWPYQFRCLGVYLGYDIERNILKNFVEKVNSMELILKQWEKRDLSLFGRVQIIKTYAVSKIVLPATVMCVPVEIVKRIQNILYKFLWRSPDKIKRTTVIQSIDKGGLNMINIQVFFDSLIASWITRIFLADPHRDTWVQLARLFTKSFDINNNLQLRYNFDKTVEFKEVANLPLFYKQVVQAFNVAFVTDKIQFEKSILNQILWGNKYINHIINGKKNVLFLRDWVRSGIRKVGDLHFVNGILDESYLYRILPCKRNIYCEIMLVKNALLPYQNCLILGNNQTTCVMRPLKSRDLYNMIICNKAPEDSNMCISRNMALYCNRNDEICAFTEKVLQEKEIKLKEFNFKVLHGILACNYNLMKWKIRLDNTCDVCNNPQTIRHLLYDCYYVKPLWQLMNNVFGLNVSFEQILGLDKTFRYNRIATIVSFLIYKEWLLCSLKNKHRSKTIALSYFKEEMYLRIEIYKLCKSIPTRQVGLMTEFAVSL